MKPELNERYLILEEIGSGGVGRVYRARDRDSDRLVALKVIPRRTGHANLRAEFVALANLRSPNIVSVFDYGLTGDGDDYFTMELIEGPSLIEAAPEVGSPTFFEFVGGMLRGLATVHGRGMVHADIKPTNFLVDGATLAETPAQAVKLADFGLAAAVGSPGASAARGTIPYAAPEVYAGRLDARSDLYSFGAVLYELCTGRCTFPGTDLAAVLTSQRHSPPPAPAEIDEQIDARLSDLITSLLEPLPGARPQSADEVFERINELAGTDFAASTAAPVLAAGAELLGRGRELTALETLWRDAEEGRGAVVLIRGESGMGRTRLLDELALSVRLRGGRVRRLQPDSEDPLGVQLPATTTASDARFAQAEALAQALLPEPPAAPVLILVDDAQRADQRTRELLAYLARAAGASTALLCVADDDATNDRDSGGVDLAAAIAAAERGHLISLVPLDANTVAQLVASTTNAAIAGRLAEDISRVSGGNPGLATSAVAMLIERGDLVRDRGQWRVNSEAVEVPVPRDASGAAAARLEKLDDKHQRVLEVVAILGDHFGEHAARTLLDRLELGAEGLFESAIAAAAAQRLVSVDATAGDFHLSPSVIPTLLARTPELQELQIRSLAAEILASDPDTPPSLLAPHLLAIGDTRAGAQTALEAAREREQALDRHGAISWYRAAIAHLTGASELEAREKLAALETLTGQVSEARANLEICHKLSSDAPSKIRIAHQLAELERKSGQGERAIELLMEALELARTKQLVASEIETHLVLGRVLWYRAEYVAAMEHAVAGHLLASKLDDPHARADLTRLRGVIETSRGNARAALDLLSEARSLAATGTNQLLSANIEFELGRAAIHAHDYHRAIEALERAVFVFRETGHVDRVAGCLNNLGAAHYFLGNWDRAREKWEQFRRLCERLDERSELVNALNNLGSLYREQGDLEEARRLLERAAKVAGDVGHAHMEAVIRANVGEVLLRQGDLAGAGKCYMTALSEFGRLGARFDVIETQRRLCELSLMTGRATDALDQALDVARDARDANATLEEGQLHRVAAAALRANGDLESAAWFCERAREILEGIGNRYADAQVLQEAGEIACAQGDRIAGAEKLEEAIEQFSLLGARWDLRRARARLQRLRRISKGPAKIVGGGDLQLLLDITHSLSHLDVDAVLEMMLQSVLKLTSFERAFVLLLDDEGRPVERKRLARSTGWSMGEDAAFSASIARRVAASSEPILITDIAGDDDLSGQKSIVALGLRRVMCAPMLARSRTIGIVYVDSHEPSSEDQSVHLPLLEVFASQAALAVENARLNSEERRKSELMAILAHEIRNPLSGILGYADLGIAETADDDETGQLFQRIRHDGRRLRRLIDNILELARHEAGKLDWSLSPIDVGRLAADAVASSMPACERKGIAVEVITAEDAGHALGNEDRLMQVLANLLNNAAKFTPKGGSIAVSVRRESVSLDDPDAPPIPATEIDAWTPLDPGAHQQREFIRVDVSDTGPGMTEDARLRLFRKFSQGQSRQRSSGIGLGLYISREIIHRHSGSIWVESELGKGTTFSFRIPVAEE